MTRRSQHERVFQQRVTVRWSKRVHGTRHVRRQKSIRVCHSSYIICPSPAGATRLCNNHYRRPLTTVMASAENTPGQHEYTACKTCGTPVSFPYQLGHLHDGLFKKLANKLTEEKILHPSRHLGNLRAHTPRLFFPSVDPATGSHSKRTSPFTPRANHQHRNRAPGLIIATDP